MATIFGTHTMSNERNRLTTSTNMDATISLTTTNEAPGSWNSASIDLTVDAARELQHTLAVFLAPHE